MKENKFKAWDEQNKFFIDPDEVCVLGDGTIHVLDYDNKNVWHTGGPIKLLWYTGVGDIHDGDILSNNYRTDKEILRQVEFLKGHWVMTRIKGKSGLPKIIPLYEHWQLNYRTIGNIFENPELKGV